MISINLSFNIVENEYFHKLTFWIKINNRLAQTSSRKIVRVRFFIKTKSIKEDLKTILTANKSKINLIMDY